MNRWSPEQQRYVNSNRPEIDLFIREIMEVCQRRGFSISSGDYVNILEIRDYDPGENDLEHALDCTKGEEK